MTYAKLIAAVAAQTGKSPELVREILFVLPDALLRLKEGDQVRTPLGVFVASPRKERHVKMIKSEKFYKIPAGTVVRLKPGSRLRR